MEQPVYYWDPVIAPSGMVFYTGDAFPGWKGSVLIGSMQPGALVRLELAEAPPSSRGIASEASPPNAASPMPLPGP
jgi:glucose/arabinose dehydrogenase